MSFSPLAHLALRHCSVSAARCPIVFVEVSDPVGAGLVARLDRPGGSTTGFMLFEYSLSAKWIELLKQVAPNVRRAAVIRDAANPAGIAQFGANDVRFSRLEGPVPRYGTAAGASFGGRRYWASAPRGANLI
jgi:hypothetical protein